MSLPTGKTPDYWIAADVAEMESIGSGEALRVGDRAFVQSNRQSYVCLSVDGSDASTWLADVSHLRSWAGSDGVVGDDTWRFVRFDTVGGPTTSDVARNVWNFNFGREVRVVAIHSFWTGQVPTDIKWGLFRVDGNFTGEILIEESAVFSPTVRATEITPFSADIDPDWPLLVGMWVPAGSVAPSNYMLNLEWIYRD